MPDVKVYSGDSLTPTAKEGRIDIEGRRQA